ncbi:MAG: hypothetical protein J7559_11185, partial [Cohnella sp.]|nr:hypothetical protein [Cohnella sp.]
SKLAYRKAKDGSVWLTLRIIIKYNEETDKRADEAICNEQRWQLWGRIVSKTRKSTFVRPTR